VTGGSSARSLLPADVVFLLLLQSPSSSTAVRIWDLSGLEIPRSDDELGKDEVWSNGEGGGELVMR